MTSKPIVRWTIGPVHPFGFLILRHSVGQMRRLYDNSFHYVICYNGLSSAQLRKIHFLGCECVDQNRWADSLPLSPPTEAAGPAWKLYPPRLSVDVHEIFLDNDIVVVSKLAFISQFLQSTDSFFVTRAIRRRYGVFDGFVDAGVLINSGMLAVPPGRKWQDTLLRTLQMSGTHNWGGHFDEQGLVAATMQRLGATIIDDIRVSWSENKYQHSGTGLHFVGANQGDNLHWLKYCDEFIGV